MESTPTTNSLKSESLKTSSDEVLIRIQTIEREISVKKLDVAAQLLTRLYRDHPTDPRIQLTAVLLADALGNPKAARESAERAIAIAPQWAPGVMALAQVLSTQSEHDAAIGVARKAINLAPTELALLERAISIANAAGDYVSAHGFLVLALALRPAAQPIQRAIGYNLLSQSKPDEALTRFEQMLANGDADEWTKSGRAYALMKLERKTEAMAAYAELKAAYPNNERYSYYASIAAGEVPASRPESVTRALFDGYADRFDTHLVGGLRYDVPRQVADLIQRVYPTLDCSVLDLGCGTGLLGVYLGRPRGALVGVDLSSRMIEKAEKQNLYDKFHNINLLDALSETPAEQYEVIASCDVFVYVGDLTEAIKNAARILRPDGLLVFSFESAQGTEADFVLTSSQRYAHNKDVLVALCQQAGLIQIEAKASVTRQENGQDVAGYIINARKPAQ
jgi:predicted TPR repeat methyltransferase